jgi:hypothetical protein
VQWSSSPHSDQKIVGSNLARVQVSWDFINCIAVLRNLICIVRYCVIAIVLLLLCAFERK